jgi:hypothetical protein
VHALCRTKTKLLSQPTDKLEQMAVEFELATTTSGSASLKEVKEQVDEKLAAIKDAKKNLALRLTDAEKYKAMGVLLTEPPGPPGCSKDPWLPHVPHMRQAYASWATHEASMCLMGHT